jgi:cytochrome P450
LWHQLRADRRLVEPVIDETLLGAPPARAEATVTLNIFLDRFAALTRGTGPAVRQTGSLVVLGFQQLPLVLAAT